METVGMRKWVFDPKGKNGDKQQTLKCLVDGDRRTGKTSCVKQILKKFFTTNKVAVFTTYFMEDEYPVFFLQFNKLENLKVQCPIEKGVVFVFDGFDVDQLLKNEMFVSLSQTEQVHIIVVPDPDSKLQAKEVLFRDDRFLFNTYIAPYDSVTRKYETHLIQQTKQISKNYMIDILQQMTNFKKTLVITNAFTDDNKLFWF